MRTLELSVITDSKTSKTIEVMTREQSYTGDPDSIKAFESSNAINSDELAINKFTDNTSGRLISERIQEIAQVILNLEECPSIVPLMKLVSS